MSRSHDSAAVDFNRLLETSDVEVDTSTLVEIDRGFSSTVYGNDDKVVKILSAVHPT